MRSRLTKYSLFLRACIVASSGSLATSSDWKRVLKGKSSVVYGVYKGGGGPWIVGRPVHFSSSYLEAIKTDHY
jgi:hypothetical protein